MSSVSASPTRLKFWGTRGSISVPGPGTLRYGGNSTCVEVRADGQIIVLDAGSGIRSLGIALEKEFQSQPIRLSLLITHAHWDHIQGLPFFAPAYEKKNEIRVRGYDGVDTSFGEIMAEPMKAPFFPIAMRELSARIDIKKLTEMEFSCGKVQVRARFVNHPGVCAGYRLFTSAGSIAFLPDHEPYRFLHSARANDMSPEQAKKTATEERIAPRRVSSRQRYSDSRRAVHRHRVQESRRMGTRFGFQRRFAGARCGSPQASAFSS